MYLLLRLIKIQSKDNEGDTLELEMSFPSSQQSSLNALSQKTLSESYLLRA